MKTAAELYLDLMIACLANTLYGDAPQDPWSGGNYQSPIRQEGRDWPSQAHSMIGVKRLENLRQLTQRVLSEGIAGDLIETGVWRGGACILMRAVLAAYRVTDRHVYVADSFSGLPPPQPDLYPADTGDQHHLFEALAVPQSEVEANFAAYGLLDAQVRFLPGWFEQTLPPLRQHRFALIRLDGDMYSSTTEALTSLYPALSPGGFCIIDDYGAIPACRAAVEDYRAREAIDAPIHAVDWTGVWWQKP